MCTRLGLATLVLLTACAGTQRPEPAAAAPPPTPTPAAPSVSAAPAAAVPDELPGERARALVDQGALLLDVRSPEEYAQGHLRGAQNLPLPSLQAGTRPTTALDAPVVLYCRTGKRSAEAVRVLREAGFQDLHLLGAMERGVEALGTEP